MCPNADCYWSSILYYCNIFIKKPIFFFTIRALCMCILSFSAMHRVLRTVSMAAFVRIWHGIPPFVQWRNQRGVQLFRSTIHRASRADPVQRPWPSASAGARCSRSNVIVETLQLFSPCLSDRANTTGTWVRVNCFGRQCTDIRFSSSLHPFIFYAFAMWYRGHIN